MRAARARPPSLAAAASWAGRGVGAGATRDEGCTRGMTWTKSAGNVAGAHACTCAALRAAARVCECEGRADHAVRILRNGAASRGASLRIGGGVKGARICESRRMAHLQTSSHSLPHSRHTRAARPPREIGRRRLQNKTCRSRAAAAAVAGRHLSGGGGLLYLSARAQTPNHYTHGCCRARLDRRARRARRPSRPSN